MMPATRDETLDGARLLASQGWTLLPCDTPETGLRGFVAFRYVDKETRAPVAFGDLKSEEIDEETRFIQWPLFDQALVPEDLTVDAPELVGFLSGGELALCDDPKRRLLGFVRYEPEQGRSVIRRISLTQLKESDQQAKDQIMATRNRLLEIQRAEAEQWIRETAAVMGAGKATRSA